jgi:transcriptional regulator with XRE-family HTH domain
MIFFSSFEAFSGEEKLKYRSTFQTAKQLETSTSVIGRYERDEMPPSIEAAKKLAKILDTTVGYLLGETDQADIFKILTC